MSTMHEALAQYIGMRRALGAKLREPAVRLSQFVEFLKNQGAEFITTELALRWAMQPKHAQRATWARRLSIVRRFAMWLNAADPRTQVPPHRLIGGRGRRNPPHIYTDDELQRLIAEAFRLRSRKRLRAHTLYNTHRPTRGHRPSAWRSSGAYSLGRGPPERHPFYPRVGVRKIPLRPNPQINQRGPCPLRKTSR
jgi:hypothetical protein